jgi:hypothetical protein
MMSKKKPLKVYTIFRDCGKWTCQSNVYGCVERTVANVAATSLKQALAVTYKGVWSKNGTTAGILEMISNDRKHTPNGTSTKDIDLCLNYKHGRVVKPMTEAGHID